jgi:hypothetical protein
MKRIVVMAVLALALPVAAFAGNVDLTNTGGTLWGSAGGLTLSNSSLTQISYDGGKTFAVTGSVTFSTAALEQGSIAGGGTFGAGGSFKIYMNGALLFSGAFSSPVYWEKMGSSANGSIYYTLSGSISGTWYNANGSTEPVTCCGTTQITFKAGKDGFMGSVPVGSGNTTISTVPEPGTLGLLGTGLVGLAGVVRKKCKV